MSRPIKLFEGENILLECHPKSILTEYNTARLSLGYTIGFVIATLFYMDKLKRVPELITESGIASRPLTILVFIIIIFMVCVYIKNAVETSKKKYVFTDQRCILVSGFIGTNQNIIPYNRIADVNINQTSFQALWGLTMVILDEQVGFGRKTLIQGLSMNDAENITQVISKHITKKMT